MALDILDLLVSALMGAFCGTLIWVHMKLGSDVTYKDMLEDNDKWKSYLDAANKVNRYAFRSMNRFHINQHSNFEKWKQRLFEKVSKNPKIINDPIYKPPSGPTGWIALTAVGALGGFFYVLVFMMQEIQFGGKSRISFAACLAA